MDKLECIKLTLIDMIYNQLDELEKVNAKELGEVIDMIKDIEEINYYSSMSGAVHK